jgi:hypothetical protein
MQGCTSKPDHANLQRGTAFFLMQHYVGAKQKAAKRLNVTADCEMLLFVRLRCVTD